MYINYITRSREKSIFMWAEAAEDGSSSENWRPTLSADYFIWRENVVSLMGSLLERLVFYLWRTV